MCLGSAYFGITLTQIEIQRCGARAQTSDGLIPVRCAAVSANNLPAMPRWKVRARSCQVPPSRSLASHLPKCSLLCCHRPRLCPLRSHSAFSLHRTLNASYISSTIYVPRSNLSRPGRWCQAGPYCRTLNTFDFHDEGVGFLVHNIGVWYEYKKHSTTKVRGTRQ